MAENNRVLRLERVFDAPRETVFKAWTDERLIAQWWGPQGFTAPVCEWDTRSGKINVVMEDTTALIEKGAKFPMTGRFKEIEAPKRLVYTSSPIMNGKPIMETLVTVTFEDQDGKTKLTLHVFVTKTTPEAEGALAGMEMGWSQSLDKLAGTFVQAGQTMAESQLLVERKLAAPVARVWQALTDPDDLKKWCAFFPDFKPEVGFKTQFMLGPDTAHQYLHHVTVLEVVPNEKLSYSWDYGGMSPHSSVSFELFADGDATKLVLTCHINPRPTDQPDFETNTSQGWNYTADELKKFVEE